MQVTETTKGHRGEKPTHERDGGPRSPFRERGRRFHPFFGDGPPLSSGTRADALFKGASICFQGRGELRDQPPPARSLTQAPRLKSSPVPS
jgi:hypothetical protein